MPNNRTATYFIFACVVAFALVWAVFERSNMPALQNPGEADGLNRLEPAGKGLGKAPDIAIAHKGAPVRLSDFKGKVVLIDFWATWCGPCRESIPGIVSLYKKYKDQGFEVMGPALEHDAGDFIPMTVERLGISYPVGLPTERGPLEAYQAEALPTSVLVDKQGNVRWRQSGYLPGMEKTVEQFVQQLLAE